MGKKKRALESDLEGCLRVEEKGEKGEGISFSFFFLGERKMGSNLFFHT